MLGSTVREIYGYYKGLGVTVNPRKLEHGFRRISARIPYTLP